MKPSHSHLRKPVRQRERITNAEAKPVHRYEDAAGRAYTQFSNGMVRRGDWPASLAQLQEANRRKRASFNAAR